MADETHEAIEALKTRKTPGRFRSGVKTIFGLLSWTTPFLIMAIGYFAFPLMREPVDWPWKATPEIFLGVSACMLVTFVWLFTEIRYAANQNSSLSELLLDSVISTALALGLTFFGAMLIFNKVLSWWYVVPWFGVVADSFTSSWFAVNNAFQKNPTQITKGG